LAFLLTFGKPAIFRRAQRFVSVNSNLIQIILNKNMSDNWGSNAWGGDAGAAGEGGAGDAGDKESGFENSDKREGRGDGKFRR